MSTDGISHTRVWLFAYFFYCFFVGRFLSTFVERGKSVKNLYCEELTYLWWSCILQFNMYILYFSQAEIAERKVRRKQAKEKKAEIIPDPDFSFINKDRDEFKCLQRDPELYYPVLKQRSSFSALDIFPFFSVKRCYEKSGKRHCREKIISITGRNRVIRI